MPSLRIGDVLTRRKEVVLLQDDEAYRQVTISLNHNGVKLRGVKRGSEIGTKRQYQTRSDDFILSRIDARNAAFGIVPEELDGAIITNDFLSFAIEGERMDRDYFYLLTQTDTFLDACVRASTGTTNRQRIQEDFFLDYTFDVPDLPAQQRAVRHYQNLSGPLARIASALEAQAADLATLRARLLDDAVRGRLTHRDPDDEPASALLTRIAAEKKRLYKAGAIRKPKKLPPASEDEQPFDLPDGWAWARLGKLGATQTGTTPKKSNPDFYGGSTPLVKPGNLAAGRISYDGDSLTEEGAKAARIAHPHSVLMVCIGGSIGKTATNNRLCAFNQQINSIAPAIGSDTMCRYLALALQSPDFQNSVIDKAGTSTIPIINQTKWANLILPLPPLAEQRRIAARVDELMALCDRLEARLTRAQSDAEALTRAVLAEALGAA